jgi:hypothetical protein
MKLSLPPGWTLANTATWTFLVVLSAKISLWALDFLAPMAARAAQAAGG